MTMTPEQWHQEQSKLAKLIIDFRRLWQPDTHLEAAAFEKELHELIERVRWLAQEPFRQVVGLPVTHNVSPDDLTLKRYARNEHVAEPLRSIINSICCPGPDVEPGPDWGV